MLLTKLQPSTTAVDKPLKMMAPVLPLPSTEFVMLVSRTRTVMPLFRKTVPSPLPLDRSMLQVRRMGQCQLRLPHMSRPCDISSQAAVRCR